MLLYGCNSVTEMAKILLLGYVLYLYVAQHFKNIKIKIEQPKRQDSAKTQKKGHTE